MHLSLYPVTSLNCSAARFDFSGIFFFFNSLSCFSFFNIYKYLYIRSDTPAFALVFSFLFVSTFFQTFYFWRGGGGEGTAAILRLHAWTVDRIVVKTSSIFFFSFVPSGRALFSFFLVWKLKIEDSH